MRKNYSNTAFAVFCCMVVAFSLAQSAIAQFVCQPNGAPIVQTGAIAAGDPSQTNRPFRDGVPSSCTGGAPTSSAVAGTYRYDSYNYTNPTGLPACVTVDFDFSACGGNSTQLNAYSTFSAANSGTGLIGKPGFSTTGTGTLGFPIAAGGSFTLVVHEVVANTGCPAYTFTVRYRTNCRQAGFDRSNDGKADPTFFRPSTGDWSTINSAGGTETRNFGLASDIITAADYTGDGQTDLSTYRTAENKWFYAFSQSNPGQNVFHVPFGIAGDVPVPGDYDKDGKSDFALWRPSNGFWYVLRSADSTVQYFQWGQSGDTPISGDFDGDLINDFTVIRPESGSMKWHIRMSNFGYGFQYGCASATPLCGGLPFGLTTDRPVPGDYDGDGRTDVAVFRPSDGYWYYLRSGTITASGALGTFSAFKFGLAGDIPQPADFDGDGRTDFAVFRPSDGNWYISNSTNGTYASYTAYNWGTATDQPASAPYRISNP